MFLAPVVFFSIWLGRRDVPVWSYLTAFAASLAAACLYFTDTAGYTAVVGGLTGLEHKYSHLLVLCIAALGIGCGAFALGILTGSRQLAKEAA